MNNYQLLIITLISYQFQAKVFVCLNFCVEISYQYEFKDASGELMYLINYLK